MAEPAAVAAVMAVAAASAMVTATVANRRTAAIDHRTGARRHRAVATVAAMTRDGLLLTARQGDADDREQRRDPKNERTIHRNFPPHDSTYA